MDILLMIFIGLTVVSVITMFILLITKNSLSLLTWTGISSMLSGFIGCMTYSSLPLNYPNRRILALACAGMCLIPFALNFVKINKNKIKSIFIKIASIFVLALNLILMFLL